MPRDKMAPPGKTQFKENELVGRPERITRHTEFDREKELYDYAEKNLKHDKGLYDSKGNLNGSGNQLLNYKERNNEWAYKANNILRNAKSIQDIPKDFIDGIRLLDKAFKDKNIDKNIVVYRYMDPFEKLKNLKKGTIFPEKGYMPTTCSLDYASYLWHKGGKNGYILCV